MSEDQEQTTVGVTDFGHQVLKRLEAEGPFATMLDAYRFAIGVGLASGAQRTPLVRRTTIFNIGTFDKDRSVANMLQALVSCEEEAVYRVAEELAETGFQKIAEVVKSGEFRFADFLDLANSAKKLHG